MGGSDSMDANPKTGDSKCDNCREGVRTGPGRFCDKCASGQKCVKNCNPSDPQPVARVWDGLKETIELDGLCRSCLDKANAEDAAAAATNEKK